MAILAAHAYGTHQRNRVWRTDESLWLDVTEKSPENGRGLMNYGLIQMEQGQWKAAEEYFSRALQYSPDYSYLHVNIGILKGDTGKPEEAEHHFKLAELDDPGNPVSYFYYAKWLRSAGRGDDALAKVRQAVELSPGNVQAGQLMRDILAERQDGPAVKSLAQDTLRIEPRDEAAASRRVLAHHPQLPATRTARQLAPEHWLSLSLVQFRNGDYEDAVESSGQALRLRPDYAAAYDNICAAENAMGSYAAAAAACERALALQPDLTLASNNLAVALSKGRTLTSAH